MRKAQRHSIWHTSADLGGSVQIFNEFVAAQAQSVNMQKSSSYGTVK